jgi:hypothetical protein
MWRAFRINQRCIGDYNERVICVVNFICRLHYSVRTRRRWRPVRRRIAATPVAAAAIRAYTDVDREMVGTLLHYTCAIQRRIALYWVIWRYGMLTATVQWVFRRYRMPLSAVNSFDREINQRKTLRNWFVLRPLGNHREIRYECKVTQGYLSVQ